MGLSGSKHKPGKGKEQKKGCTSSAPKPKERAMDKHSQESEKPADTTPAAGFSPKPRAAQQQGPSSAVKEKQEVKEKSNRKKLVIPQIIVTTASGETLMGYSSIQGQEQRTIQEWTEWGPFSRHRNPSTVDAYGLQSKEHVTAPE